MGTLLPFVLLIAALLLFLVSTNQWSLMIRGAIWGAGVLLLIAAGWLSMGGEGGRLFSAFGNLGDLSGAIQRNQASIAQYLFALLDLFVLLGLIVAVLALIAFTPGEEMERAIRPLMIGLIGAIFGGVIATATTGSGLGFVSHNATVAHVTDDDVLDGNTFYLGDPKIPVRLSGVDAPESDQVCRTVGADSNCGREARQHLLELIRMQPGQQVVCNYERDIRGRPDALRLPLVTCTISRDGRQMDAGQTMIRDGFAMPYRGVTRPTDCGSPNQSPLCGYADAYALAQNGSVNPGNQPAGLLTRCTLRPDIWRNDSRRRDQFRRHTYVPAKDDAFGDCSRIPRPSNGGGGADNSGGRP